MIVTLEITCWKGMSIGATHYYGHLKGYIGEEYKSVELEYKMTASQAAKLNKKDEQLTRSSGGLYSRGSVSTRFDTEEQIIKLALKVYKQHFPGADVLILGHSYIAEPQLILDGPEEVKKIINEIVSVYDKFRYGSKQQELLWDTWNTVLAPYRGYAYEK